MSRPSIAWRAAVALVLWLAALAAHAHKPSDAYLELSRGADASRLAVRWDIALRDLDAALDLDADRDGDLVWGEVRTRQDAIARLALGALGLRVPAGECRPGEVAHALDRHSDGAYAVLRFELACPGEAVAPTLSYRLFADLDPTHRAIVRSRTADGGVRAAVVAPDGEPVALDLSAGDALGGFASFVATGVHHILIGWDHLAFLCALLLPAVLRRERGGWVASTSLRASLVDVVRVVTAFTVAHSITLGLAATGKLVPPAGLVEPAIAASVALAALNNVVPILPARQWAIAFGFGLVHGFGFAGALADAGFARGALAAGLLGFNLGVELGQLAVVALLLPAIWLARGTRLYPRAVLPTASIALAIAGGFWFVERTLSVVQAAS